MKDASVPARLTAGARRAILAMAPEWQFPGKATFDATGAHCAWWRAPKAVQRELQADGVRKGKRWAYRLTEYGSALRAALRDSGRLPGGEDPSGAECEASQSGGSEASASPKPHQETPDAHG